jgi:hypothetical protein
VTNEQFSREEDYLVAADLTARLLESGVISEDDFKRVTAYFIDRFKPLAVIPKTHKLSGQNGDNYSDNAPLCLDVFAEKSEHEDA